MLVDAEVRNTTHGHLQVALATAEASRRIDPYRVAAEDVRVGVSFRRSSPGLRAMVETTAMFNTGSCR
jgi:hypothetical protein